MQRFHKGERSLELPFYCRNAALFGNEFATRHCVQHLSSLPLHHDPREPRVKSVKMIVRYLKATKDHGLILKPDKSLALDSYVDANFAGLYGAEDQMDPVCVKNRTGYFIVIGGCPLIWKSKLQQLIALSTTEAETNAVCDMMRVLLPLRLLIQEMSSYFGLKRTYHIRTHSTVWEDNNGCITICNQDQVTPRSKHNAIHLFWWKSLAERPNIQVKKISTEEQLADCATKGLPRQRLNTCVDKLWGGNKIASGGFSFFSSLLADICWLASKDPRRVLSKLPFHFTLFPHTPKNNNNNTSYLHIYTRTPPTDARESQRNTPFHTLMSAEGNTNKKLSIHS